MRRAYSAGYRPVGVLFALTSAILVTAPAQKSLAGNLLGFYAGAAVGQSRVDAGSGGLVPSPTDHFGRNHSAFQLMAGIRPISLLGAEVAYVDFGHPSGELGGAPADVSMRAVAAFGVLYLPVPLIDVYLKAGTARLQSTINGTAYAVCTLVVPGGTCQPTVPFRVDRTNTNFAAGAGAQYKIGSLAVRAEYERFTTTGGKPDLVTLGLTWTF